MSVMAKAMYTEIDKKAHVTFSVFLGFLFVLSRFVAVSVLRKGKGSSINTTKNQQKVHANSFHSSPHAPCVSRQ
jgi:hypothetical protein